MSDKPEIRKWKPYTKRWETEANAIARGRYPLVPCPACGYPKHAHSAACNGCGIGDALDRALAQTPERPRRGE